MTHCSSRPGSTSISPTARARFFHTDRFSHAPGARLVRELSAVVCLALAAASVSLAGAAEADAAKSGGTGSPTYAVKRGALKSRVQFDAVFESAAMAPVRIQAKGVAELTVVEAVPHGTRVKKGDVLVKIDTEKLREQLEDMELERPGATLALELAEAELANLVQTTPHKLEAARRAQRNAAEDLAYFEAVGKPSREKGVVFGLKSSEQRLDGAREELKQLKKMYDADDLTEETEEIILKRQKFAVESAEYSHELTKQSSELTLKTTLPREYEAMRNARRDADIAAAYADETLARTLAKKRLDVEKQRRDQKKSEKRLAELKKDLEETTVIAPADGVVYYGACEDGRWTTGAAVAKRLVPGGKVAPREVLMTIVTPDKLVLRGVVTEGDVARLKPGQAGQVAPVSAPDRKLPVTLEQLGSFPQPGGGFEARLGVGRSGGVRLVPGMNGKVTFEGGKGADALLVPKDAVFGEGADRHVFLAGKGGPVKRAVQVGGSDDRMVEIEDGLSAGDVILTRKPE